MFAAGAGSKPDDSIYITTKPVFWQELIWLLGGFGVKFFLGFEGHSVA